MPELGQAPFVYFHAMENGNKAEQNGSAADVTEAVPEVEERVAVSKRRVPAGKVRVKTSTEEHEQIVQSTLEADCVEVKRIPIGKEIKAVPKVRTENGVTIVPVVEEALVVTKQLLLKEELHIRRRTEIESVEIPVTLRRQTAVVEHLDASGEPRESKPLQKEE